MPIQCFECGIADLQAGTVSLTGTVRGQEYTVKMKGLLCPKCGYKTIEGSDMQEFGRLLADKYRAAHGLLTSAEIRAQRKNKLMSQEEFARYLGVGVASVKRWEMGKIQDKDSNDRIIRMTQPVLKDSNAFSVSIVGIGGTTVKFNFPFKAPRSSSEKVIVSDIEDLKRKGYVVDANDTDVFQVKMGPFQTETQQTIAPFIAGMLNEEKKKGKNA